MVVEESADNVTWTIHPTNPSTTSKSNFDTSTLLTQGTTRYLRIREATDLGDDFDFDAVEVTWNCTEICNNGIDDDGDGLTDCDDPDCKASDIVSVDTNSPSNCPDLNNGTITINTSENHLEFSIDNGNTFQSTNTFTNLQKGSYNCLLYTSPSPRDATLSRMPSSA